jgi:DnaK suppressor protein
MATKKATSRKGAVRKTSRAVTRKKAAKKKTSAKRAVSSRKTSAKKAAKKRTSKTVTKKKASKKKPAAKKATARKTAKKPASKKKAAAKKKSSVKKAAAKKKAAPKKKSSVKKATVKKKAAPKKKAVVKKKASVKKTPAKAAAKKKAAPKKAAGPKKLSKKARAAKTAAAKRLATPPVRRVGPDAAMPRRRRKRAVDSDSLIHGIAPYTAGPGEEYMSDEQLDHFRDILNAWKQELMEEVDRTVHHMQDEASNFPDPTDRATQESEFGLELRTRDRERKLLKKIDQAIARVDDGSYGFCEETGEEIGLKRLEARPVATLSVEAQERRELAERQYRDRDDQYR